MLLSLRENSLTSLFKEVRVFKVISSKAFAHCPETITEIICFQFLRCKTYNSVQTRRIVKARLRKVHFSGDFLGVFDFLRIACSLGIPQENL